MTLPAGTGKPRVGSPDLWGRPRRASLRRGGAAPFSGHWYAAPGRAWRRRRRHRPPCPPLGM